MSNIILQFLYLIQRFLRMVDYFTKGANINDAEM